MQIELTSNVFWDTDKPFDQQVAAAQTLAYITSEQQPITESRESTLNENTRPVVQTFDFFGHTLQVTYQYNGVPDSKEWAGVENIIMEVFV